MNDNHQYLRRLSLIAVTLLAVAFGADCREIYCQSPVALKPGTISVDTLPEFMIDCDYHLRVDIPRNCGDASWSVTIGYADGRSTRISLLRPGKSAAESDYGLPLEVSVSRLSADSAVTDNRSYTINNDVDPTLNSWSLTLSKRPDDNGLLCSVGQRSAMLQFDTESDNPRLITARTDSPIKLLRLSCFTDSSERLTATDLKTINQLAERLAGSTDAREGYWLYLDRDTDPRMLNTGGSYRLATVARPDGCIEIIYLGGAKSAGDRWKPMMLKGLLTPTTFVNHYNLVWYDAYGSRIDSETSADITDGSILRLNFPLHGGSIRFQKSKTSP